MKFLFADDHPCLKIKISKFFYIPSLACLFRLSLRMLMDSFMLPLAFRFTYDNWFMPHTAAKLKFPYYWDEECLRPPQKDEL